MLYALSGGKKTKEKSKKNLARLVDVCICTKWKQEERVFNCRMREKGGEGGVVNFAARARLSNVNWRDEIRRLSKGLGGF